MVVNIIRYSFWTGHHVWLLPYNDFCFELLVPINQVFIKFSKQMIHNLPFMSSSHVRCFFVEFRLSYLKKNSLTTFHWCIRNSEDCKSSKSLLFDSQMRKCKPSSFILWKVRLSRLWFLNVARRTLIYCYLFVATENYPANQIKSWTISNI